MNRTTRACATRRGDENADANVDSRVLTDLRRGFQRPSISNPNCIPEECLDAG